MSWIRNVRDLMRRGRLERELDEETQFHLREREHDLVEQGMPQRQAREAARRAFGNLAAIKEHSRQTWGLGALESVARDVGFSFRTLRKQKWMSAVVVLSLGIGIGINTAALTGINGVIFRPPPLYRDTERLVVIRESSPLRRGEFGGVSRPVFEAWKTQPKAAAELAAAGPVRVVSFRREDFPLSIEVQALSANLLPMLGVDAELGRAFRAADEDDGSEPVVVLSHHFWRQHFEGDRGVIGKPIWLDGESHSVIGVMPERFYFQGPRIAMWTPLRRERVDRPGPHQIERSLQVVGKLATGGSAERLLAGLELGLRQVEKQFPAAEQGGQVIVVPFVGADFHLSGIAPGFWLLFGAVLLSLLIACMNIATVMAARWTAQQKETAVRLALGAGRLRLLRQFLTESVLLSSLGGLAAVLFTYGGLRALLAIAPPDARFFDFAIDGTILGFTAALTLATGLLSGLAPALVDTKLDLCEELKLGQVRSVTKGVRQRLRTVLVVAEVAVTTVLLILTGGLVQSYRELDHRRLDFDARNLLLFQINLDAAKYTEKTARAETAGAGDAGGATLAVSPRAFGFYDQVLANLRGVPGISAAAVSLRPPPFDALGGTPVFREPPVEGSRGEPLDAGFNAVSPGFFETLGVAIVRGRGFSLQDNSDAPAVAMVNAAFARRYFPQSDPLAAQLWLDRPVEAGPRQIVGIVADYTNRGVLQPPAPAIYVPLRQQSLRAQAGQQPGPLRVEFVTRTSRNVAELGDLIRREVARLDPFQAVGRITTVEQMIAQGAEEVLVGIGLQAPLVGFAFLLTTIGIYGVLAFAVHRRTHEFGIRMALGADGRQVRRVVVRHGLRMAFVGLLVGIPVSLACIRVLGSVTAVMRSTRWEVLGLTMGLVLAVTAAASYFPARRATRVDPMKALRAE